MNSTNVSFNFINSVVNNVTFFPSAFEEGCIDLENKSISHCIIVGHIIEVVLAISFFFSYFFLHLFKRVFQIQ